MTKSILKNFLVGLIGGMVGSFLFLSETSISKIEALIFSNYNVQTNSPPIQSNFSVASIWERHTSQASLGTVAIQVFRDNKIIRQGSGVTVSSDGLIITTADVATLDSVYQVFYEDKILRGILVARDSVANLAILKTSSSYSGVLDFFDEPFYKSGQEILISGKLVNLSKPAILSQRGIISYVTDNNIVLNSEPNQYLSGSAVLDSEGRIIGLASLRSGKIQVVKNKNIEDFLKKYLEKK